jgi:hypothetical protein
LNISKLVYAKGISKFFQYMSGTRIKGKKQNTPITSPCAISGGEQQIDTPWKKNRTIHDTDNKRMARYSVKHKLWPLWQSIHGDDIEPLPMRSLLFGRRYTILWDVK